MTTHATALILGVSNFVSFPAGETENRLLLQLPNGMQIEAIISDDGLASVVACFGAQTTSILHSPTPSDSSRMPDGAEPFVAPSEDASFDRIVTADGTSAYVFGQRPHAITEDTAAVVEAPPPSPVLLTSTSRKTRMVGKDNAGNPIVEVIGAISPADVTGTTGDKDEDGVSQL